MHRFIVFLDIDGPLATTKAFYHEMNRYYGTDINYLVQSPEEYQDMLKVFSSVRETSPLPRFRSDGPERPFDTDVIFRLYTLKKETNCEFVASTSWRKQRSLDELNELMKIKQFYYNFIDKTPILENRAEEILHWLSSHPTQKYIVIDDESKYLSSLGTSFIKTHPYYGFDDICLEQALNHFLD